MFDISPIENQLARLTPPQRKQYVQMHKNDPYIVSLALNMDNREKAKASALMGQQQAPAQPPVVEQMISQMGAPAQAPMQQGGMAQAMPEDVGIGALPARNMENMAEGGIVAFGNGGDVPGFAKGVYIGEDGQYYADPLSADELGQTDTWGPLKKLGAWAGRNVERDPITGEVTRKSEAVSPAATAPATAPATSTAYTPYEAGYVPSSVAPGGTSTAVKGGISSLQAAAAAAGSQSREPRAAGTVVGRPAAPAQSYLEQYAETRKAQGPSVDPEAVARNKLVADRNTASQATKTELETDIESRKDQFAKREERQDTRAAALEKSKDTNTGMAFLQAGLAMMQAKGPGLAAIAQGAGVGVNQYAAGLKDLKLAQEKLDEARDKTDELKQNQSMMDKKELRTAKKDIRDTELQGQEYLIAGRSKTHGEELAVAAAATKSDIEARQKIEENASRERIAAMAHAAGLRPSETERVTATYLKLKATDPAAAETYMQGIERSKGAGKSTESKIADTAYDNIVKQAALPHLMKNFNTPEKFNAAVEAETKRLRGASGTIPKPGAETAPPGPEIHYDAKGNRVK